MRNFRGVPVTTNMISNSNWTKGSTIQGVKYKLGCVLGGRKRKEKVELSSVTFQHKKSKVCPLRMPHPQDARNKSLGLCLTCKQRFGHSDKQMA